MKESKLEDLKDRRAKVSKAVAALEAANAATKDAALGNANVLNALQVAENELARIEAKLRKQD